jgi:hypothetical protein
VDFHLTSRQAALVAAVTDMAGTIDPAELQAVASAGSVLGALEGSLAGLLAPASTPLDRVLVVETAARLGLPTVLGPRLLVGWEVSGDRGSQPIAFVDRDRPGPVRNAQFAARGVVVRGDTGWVVDLAGQVADPIESSFGFPYGEVPELEGTPLEPAEVAAVRCGWHLALAAEIAGTAQGGLDHLCAYLAERRQFGKPLASFQALRHRVAELAVSTEAALWLAREAAGHGSEQEAAVACAYARDLAAVMAPELVQLSGARGFAREFPVHLYASRLEGLRLEAGTSRRIAAEYFALKP